MKIFQDRRQAGRELGERLSRLGFGENVALFALAGGGVAVADEAAKALRVPVNVLSVRKLRAPFAPGLTLGAVARDDVAVYNEEVVEELELTEDAVELARRRALAELKRQERECRRGRPLPNVAGRTVVLVDDGIDTGATMYAAVLAARALEPSSIVAAVPTSARDSVARVEEVADRVVALATPQPYRGVAAYYSHFPRVAPDGLLPFIGAPRDRNPSGSLSNALRVVRAHDRASSARATS